MKDATTFKVADVVSVFLTFPLIWCIIVPTAY